VSGRVDHSPRVAEVAAESADPAVGHSDVDTPRGRAGAVDDVGAANEKVVHQRSPVPISSMIRLTSPGRSAIGKWPAFSSFT
jgi:hypothetical protein